MEMITLPDGETKRIRPVHTCKGMWIARLDMGPGLDGKQRRVQRARTTKPQAVAALDDLKTQYAQHGDLPTRRLTVEQWLTQWLEEIVLPKKAPKTYERYRTEVVRHLIPSIGRHKLEQLQPKHLRELYKYMRKQGIAGSRPQAHAVLRKALSDAMRESLVMRNVAKLVDTPSGNNTKRGVLSPGEARKLLAYTSEDVDGKPRDRNYSRWVMALLTGTRPGECLGLTWDRVNLAARKMDISWQLKRLTFLHGCGEQLDDETWLCGKIHGGRCPDRYLRVPDGYEYQQLHGGLCLTKPKTQAGIRLMAMPPPLYAALKAHQEFDTTPNLHNLVWHEPNGQPIQLQDDTNRWAAHLKTLKLPPVVLYEARHTTMTLLMESGADATVIKNIAGHSSLAVQEAYKHVDIRHMAEALDKVAATLYLKEIEG